MPFGMPPAQTGMLSKERQALARPSGLNSEALHEPHGVIGRAALGVVVAVGVNVLPQSGPTLDLAGPLVQGLIAVAAGVQLVVTMQPDIHEVRCDLFDKWPFAWAVGNDQRDLLATQQLVEGGITERLVANLNGVPYVLICIGGLGQSPIRWYPLIMICCDLGPLSGRPRQLLEESVQSPCVESQVRRQLPQNRSQLRTQRQHAGGKEVGQWGLDSRQLLHVGDEPPALHTEDEGIWYG